MIFKDSKVLVVDDDRSMQVYLFSLLQKHFELRSAYTGDEALAMLVEYKPDCILLDITMPGKSGYETCREIKLNPATKNIPVLFLTSKNSMQEKVLGFELGAEDYLLKTTESEVLRAKISRAVAQHRQFKELGNEVAAAQHAAFGAMSGSADLGCCIRFVERTYVMNSFDKLAEGIFHTMAEFGLRASVMFVSNSGPLFYSANGQEVSPLERDMFIATHDEGRFCDFADRTFCNFKLVSLLVKNMPVDDPERYGRIKDAIPWILGATDSKARELNDKTELLQRIGEAQTIVGDSRGQLIELAAKLATMPSEQTAIEQVNSQLGHLEFICDLVARAVRQDDLEIEKKTELGREEIFSSGVDLF